MKTGMAPTIPIDYTGYKETTRFSKAGLGDMNGKARKVSKGYSSGFMPDYRHAVETVAESQGLGSSGRVGMELDAPEDSYALKRKSVSMNSSSYDQFGVPTRVFSLSQMSLYERRNLEISLKSELEQVRMLQSKIAFSSSNITAGLPSADIHSYHNGPYSTNMSMAAGKRTAAVGKNGTHTKGGSNAFKRTESMKQGSVHHSNFASLLKQCQQVLNRVMQHKEAWIFNEPVDIKKHHVPDYHLVIKHPMDLGTIKQNLRLGKYVNPMDFAADVRLTFQNAMTYNPVGNGVHNMAVTVSKFFEVRWKPIEKKISMILAESASRSSVVEPEISYPPPPAKKQKTSFVENVKQEIVKRVMSDVEKQKLSAELEACLEDLPEKIINFLKQNSANGSQVSEDEIEIDIDALGDDTLFMLRKLLDDHMHEKQNNQTRVEQCEIEINTESGFSNLSTQPGKEDGPVDEDVDIGGDDPPPISSSTPVDIHKDSAKRTSNGSSSSSSGSDSGSTSSGSDSGNSSPGEKDDANNGSVDRRLEQKESGSGATSSRGITDGNADQSPSNSPDSRQEGGEGVPLDRQASPEKLYRAALLRSRFADIIIKAQENTTEKGERPDPEKLRLEREELEKRRKEEKARLQAEAKVAEEARKKAEIKAAAEAAAQAKKRRELEREAARQALQNMEKTVDIDENSQFMDNLEMFTATAPEEQLPSFIEEASPENSLDPFGSFKFQGNSNPLEQLGLYMKNDEDDEEETDAVNDTPPKGINDHPEEGEID